MKKPSNLLIILLLCVVNLSGYPADGKNEKILNKNREIINNSAPDDWYTLASCAKSCLKKNVLNKEVAEWIDRSIEIKKTSYNLEIKGDYYIINKLPDKAGEYYLEAIRVGFDEDKNFDSSKLQSKIAKIVNLKT
jgi:hypothetical protein